ncbi:hypothetical protein ACYU03_10925 [Pseudomonas sp. X10]
MTGINSVTLSSAANVLANSEQSAVDEAEPASRTVDFSRLRASAGGQGASKTGAAEESGEPEHIKQLREQIRQLQKQLVEQQKQLADLMRSNMEETAKLAAVTALQASIATLSGELQSATALLLEALTKSGGSSAGGMLSTQA